MNNVEIQIQDGTGNWRTYNVLTVNNDAMILNAMNSLRWQFPDSRIRAMCNGQIVNIM